MVNQTNDKNFEFYNKIGIDTFKDLSQKGGFNTHKDLEIASKFIKSSDDILEIGAGYGRCLDYFIGIKHQGKLTAIEQSPELITHLELNYQGKVEIIKGDIKSAQLKNKVDVALWMWSGIIDFSPEEQSKTIKHIASMLNPGGRMIIDVPKIGFQTIGVHQDAQHLKVVTPFGEIECYIPSLEDMKAYCSEHGLNFLEEIYYKTTSEKERTIYVISCK